MSEQTPHGDGVGSTAGLEGKPPDWQIAVIAPDWIEEVDCNTGARRVIDKRVLPSNAQVQPERSDRLQPLVGLDGGDDANTA
ncbi:hypothetical protein [Nevskia sp.]|uniref:hypothetical protein n=1 Tax=Nevskia sp. TaxID=1929292 RepID=UPI0025F44A3D|nr:hypothetical protein [Nevskia sp.]